MLDNAPRSGAPVHLAARARVIPRQHGVQLRCHTRSIAVAYVYPRAVHAHRASIASISSAARGEAREARVAEGDEPGVVEGHPRLRGERAGHGDARASRGFTRVELASVGLRKEVYHVAAR